MRLACLIHRRLCSGPEALDFRWGPFTSPQTNDVPYGIWMLPDALPSLTDNHKHCASAPTKSALDSRCLNLVVLCFKVWSVRGVQSLHVLHLCPDYARCPGLKLPGKLCKDFILNTGQILHMELAGYEYTEAVISCRSKALWSLIQWCQSWVHQMSSCSPPPSSRATSREASSCFCPFSS